jgi:hypothetical protein
MTFAELQAAALEELGERDNIHFSVAMVKRWLNEGYRDIATKTGCIQRSSTVTITLGSKEVTIPTDLYEVVGLNLLGGENAAYPLSRGYETEVGDTSTTGIPTTYSVWNGKLIVSPVPDAGYTATLRYLAYPTDLSATTDVPEFPSVYHTALVLYAAMKGFIFDNAVDKGMYYRNEFKAQADALAMDVANRRGAEMVSEW